ncbi:hypothetical protein ABIB80_007494 [Bradyrhizobium sp. i1.15.2]|uniref:hypothetical protein n=1 Tax=Bradyrhizobium sp. i1.15.2 TaxID=3156362 RepID=UPI0033982898
MKQAGDIADRTTSAVEDRLSRINPSAASFIGNFASNLVTKGFDKAIDLVQDLTRRFTELNDTAKLVGVSMNEIFCKQEAAGKFGAPVDDVTTSVRNLAVLLDQVQRGEKNSLSNLFHSNPEALKGVNVQALNLQHRHFVRCHRRLDRYPRTHGLAAAGTPTERRSRSSPTI